MAATPSFTEHHVARGQGRLHARDYGGAGPAFVLMHGFPDNLHIYDDLIPHLVSAGRRVVAFDFLGFGASDKPADARYSFEQQVGDLKAVVGHLGLGSIVPVAHDSSGIVSLRYALAHPHAVASVIMLNSAYAEGADMVWPEMITLFATPGLRELALAITQDPAQFGWLLTWQQRRFTETLPPAMQRGMQQVIGPLVQENFTTQPSAGVAFVQMTAQFFAALGENAARAADLKALDIPVKLIWGDHDPYFPVAVAERRLTQLRRATLTVIEGGHWLQVDDPGAVARAMLS